MIEDSTVVEWHRASALAIALKKAHPSISSFAVAVDQSGSVSLTVHGGNSVTIPDDAKMQHLHSPATRHTSEHFFTAYKWTDGAIIMKVYCDGHIKRAGHELD